MKKFGLILMSLMLLFSFALAACSTDEDGESTSDKPADEKPAGDETPATETPSDEVVELTFQNIPNTGLDVLVKQYESENPNVTINYQEVEFNDHHNGLVTALAAGSGIPDIAFVEIGFLETFKGDQGNFTNLYDLGAKDVTGDYLDWKIKQSENADGSFLFGLPTDIGPMAMAYRTDIFEAAGLPTEPDEVSALITNWDEFVEVGKTVVEKTGKPMTDSGGTIYDTMVGQLTEVYFDENNELLLESNVGVKEAYDRATAMVAAGITAKVGQWSPEWNAGINDGGFATLMAPAWMMNFMKSTAPDGSGNWNIAQMPVASGNWGGSFLTIPAASEHPEEAYAFIEWLLSVDHQYEIFKATGNFPSTPSIYDKPEIQDWTDEYFQGASVGKIYAEAALKVVPVYFGPDHQTVNTAIKDAINNVENNDADPQAEWDAAIERVSRELR
ncbi:ABC transporter substrate-binding protein [Chengkuizengella sediminis]|uniref:ABC transporter substrate-binding protein n=1 Tax=Chengkuizengella sediminis TaxID=1885917 RepID=UPI0013898DB7|nr:extracellular solute-binding protein [Chengkuizengella sediminis]NDI35876.1 extracellular solute-binding protein [Chengkuizengella sediminis]